MYEGLPGLRVCRGIRINTARCPFRRAYVKQAFAFTSYTRSTSTYLGPTAGSSRGFSMPTTKAAVIIPPGKPGTVLSYLVLYVQVCTGKFLGPMALKCRAYSYKVSYQIKVHWRYNFCRLRRICQNVMSCKRGSSIRYVFRRLLEVSAFVHRFYDHSDRSGLCIVPIS